MFFAILFIVIGVNTARAEFQIPEKPEGYVTDRAALLSADARNRLEAYLHDFETKTSNQVVVAAFSSLEGGSLEDISIRIAQKWKIGQKGRDNGVIFLIFKDDHAMRIEVGYGLEGVLTDALAAHIIRSVVTPEFRQGRFEAGIEAGVQAICAATQGEYQALPEASNDNEGVYKFLVLAGIFLIWLLVMRIPYRRNGYWSSSSRYGGGSGFSGGGYSGGGFSGGGGGFGGGGASGRW